MRKIEQHVISAFVRGESARMSNTDTDGYTLRLHGHPIARRHVDGDRLVYMATLAGWPTPTTRSRLNALASMVGGDHVYQRNHEQFIADDKPVNADEWWCMAIA